MALSLFSRKPSTRRPPYQRLPRPSDGYVPSDVQPLPSDPLQQCVQLERFGIVLQHREQWSGHGNHSAVFRAVSEAIDARFGLVPEGFVSLPQTVNDYPGCPETDIETQAFLLARCPVTNAQYQKFVDARAYEELELWPADIWPLLIEFKDQTGSLGPRYWRHGRHDKRLADHPVVGVSFYEAQAYARWAGYRLPTEAEWQMAASWRLRSASHVRRRYPWGDALDTRHCNIWASDVRGTTPVTVYPSGAAPNGVLQLIGNVWEWTASEFQVVDEQSRAIVGDMTLTSIRGGAFDTYFPSQATSEFRTGLVSLARAYNVGFRCALDVGV